MLSIDEPFRPGYYTAVGTMNIRSAMTVTSAIVGQYRNGEPFTVFEVFAESNGIVWGRISSNTGGGSSRYVALRVNNHPKAKLTKVLETPEDEDALPADLVQIFQRLKNLEAWARAKGFRG